MKRWICNLAGKLTEAASADVEGHWV